MTSFRMVRYLANLCLVSGAVSILAICADAQDVTNASNTGYPANAVFHGTEIESVQVTNGDLHVQIPVYAAKGRGLDTAGMYVYDSKEWYLKEHCYSSGICVDQVAAEPNSNLTLTPHGSMDYGITYSTFVYHCVLSGTSTVDVYSYGVMNVVLREPDGTKHHFSPDPASLTTQPCGETTVTGILYAQDGSGWATILDSSGIPTIAIRKDGTALDASYYGSATIEDSNGNELVGTSTTTAIDTLGRTFYDGSSAAYASSSAQYIDSTGSLQSASVTATTSVAVSTQMCSFSTADQCTEHNATWTVPQVIAFPSANATYSFTYAQNQGAEITSITLPSGGTISYTYGNWQEGGRPVATRTVNSSGTSGTWTYTINNDFTTTVTDPYQNDAVYDCSAVSTGDPCYPKFTKFYSGSQSSGTLIKAVSTDYATVNLGTAGLTAANQIVLPIRKTTTWNQTNQIAKLETDWDTASVTGGTTAWMNPIEIREYDYGSGSPGALLRRTHFNYLHLQNPSYLNANIADRLTSKIVYDGNGNLLAQQNMKYDGTAVSGTSSVPGHDYAAFSTSNNIRGNLTSVSKWRDTDGIWLTTTYSYDDLGNRLTATDPMNYQTLFTYSDYPVGACAPSANTHGYVTQTTDAAGNRSQRSYFYCNGLLASTADENDIQANRKHLQIASYDSLNRPLAITYADGGTVEYEYTDSIPNSITETSSISSGISKITAIELDGMGRERKATLTSDPDGPTHTQISYDAAGRVYQRWNSTRCDPTTATNCPSEPTWGISSNGYDALGRMISQSDSDGVSTQSWNYAGNRVTFTDEDGNQWERTSDGLGRLIKLLEPNGSTKPPSMETDYSYDVLDNLIRVDQWGGVKGSSGERLRAFTYNSLSQLVSAANPETGAVNYIYDNDGNVQSKTDGRGVIINYKYDSLNRLVSKTYSGSVPAGSLSSCYQYGTSSQGNLIGRLAAEWTQAGSCPASAPASAYQSLRKIGAYDSMGRVVSEQQCVLGYCTSAAPPPAPPANCQSLTSSNGLAYCYDLAGDPTAYSNGLTADAFPQQYMSFSQGFDSAARLSSLVNNSWTGVTFPSNLLTVSGTDGYTPFNALQNWTLGSGNLSVSKSYDNRLRVTGETAIQQ